MRILIVEDEKRLAGTLQELLHRQGYTADVCYDGISGLDNARSDIYDLLEEIFKREMTDIIKTHQGGGSWLAAFMKVAEVAYSHKKIINNICSSRSYDYFENYMYKSCKYIVVDFVQAMASGMNVPDEDIEFIASFYEYALFGMISEWFRTGMREDPEHLAGQLWLVVDNIRYSLRRSERRARLGGNYI